MSEPISPPPSGAGSRIFLPAYVSNGVMGLRAPRIPLLNGVAILSGFACVHPVDRVEGFAQAPYPLAGDLSVNDVTLSGLPERAILEEQAYDFGCGELRTRFRFDAGDAVADVEVLTLCSRSQPTIALQEVTLRVDRACDVVLDAAVDPSGIPGRFSSRRSTPWTPSTGRCGGRATEASCVCGAAYVDRVRRRGRRAPDGSG